LVSKNVDQSGYASLSAYGAAASAVVTACSPIILLMSFLSQNQLN